MANNVKVVVEGENKTGKAFNEVKGSMNDLQGAAGNLQTKALLPLQKVLGTGLKVAGGVAAGAMAAVGVAIGSGVKAAAAMEQQIADIASVMNLAADETAPLKNLIQSLGLDPKLKVSATEAADAIEMLGRNGLTMTEIMDGAARGTVLLANATNADFADAADIAMDAMSLFNIQASDMKKAVDGIASVTVNSKFGINDYKLALAQAGGVAAASGVEFDDFNTVIAAISPYFASGSDAGTSFKTMLQTLIPKSNEASDVMRSLGLITADGANQFFTASGEMKSMAEVAGLLNGAMNGLTEEQKLNALSTIFGTDAMRAAAGMAGFTAEQMQALDATMAKVDSEQMAAVRMNTLSGVMEVLGGVVDTLKMQIGDAFLPVLRRLAELTTEQAQIHGPKLVAAFQNLATQLGVAMDRFLPWIEQALPKMIDQIPGIIAGIVNFGRETLTTAKAIFDAVAPVIKFVAGLTDLKGILTAVGVLMAVSAVAQVVTFVAGIVSAVTAVTGFVGALGATLPALGAVLAAIGPVIAIVAAVGAAVLALKIAWDNNLFGIRDRTREVFDWLRSVFNDFPNTLAGLRDAFYNFASSAMQRLRDGFLAGRDWARNAIDVTIDYIRGANFGGMAQGFFDQARDVVNRIGDGFRDRMGWARDQLTQVLTDVQNGGVNYAAGAMAGRLYEAARGAILRFGAGINEGSPNMRNDMQRAVDAVIGVVNSWAGGAGNHLWGKAREVMQRLAGGFQGFDVGGDVWRSLDRVVDTVNSWSNSVQGHFWNKAKEVVNALATGFGNVDLVGGLWQSLGRVVDVVNDWSNSVQGHIYGKAREIGNNLMRGLRDGISGMFGEVINKMNEVTNLLPEWLRSRLGIHSPSTVFMEIGTNIMEGLAQGLQQSMQLPEMAMATTANNLTQSTINSNNNSSRNFTFNIAGGPGTAGDPTQNVRMLTMLYGT